MIQARIPADYLVEGTFKYLNFLYLPGTQQLPVVILPCWRTKGGNRYVYVPPHGIRSSGDARSLSKSNPRSPVERWMICVPGAMVPTDRIYSMPKIRQPISDSIRWRPLQ